LETIAEGYQAGYLHGSRGRKCLTVKYIGPQCPLIPGSRGTARGGSIQHKYVARVARVLETMTARLRGLPLASADRRRNRRLTQKGFQMRTTEHSSSLTRGSVLLGCLLFLAACSSSEPKPQPAEMPPQTQQGLTALRDQMVSGKAQIQKTTDAARDLAQRPLAQIEPQINRLAQEVQTLEGMATRAGGQYETQKGQTQQYFAQWSKELETMSKQVREAGMERREQSIASLDALQNSIESLRSTFRPYMDALTESAKYLRTDPTPSGVKSITPRIQGAIDVEKTLLAKMDAVIAQIDVMRGSK
jgi:hypothetical protein